MKPIEYKAELKEGVILRQTGNEWELVANDNGVIFAIDLQATTVRLFFKPPVSLTKI